MLNNPIYICSRNIHQLTDILFEVNYDSLFSCSEIAFGTTYILERDAYKCKQAYAMYLRAKCILEKNTQINFQSLYSLLGAGNGKQFFNSVHVFTNLFKKKFILNCALLIGLERYQYLSVYGSTNIFLFMVLPKKIIGKLSKSCEW